jgi:hypothetical protein
MIVLQPLEELRARRWWRRQLRGPLAGRLTERDRVTIESHFAYGHPDPEQAYLGTKLRREIEAESAAVAARILRTFAAALRDGESIENAFLAATLKLVLERESGMAADRDELMEAFRQGAREELRRLGLDDPRQ